MAVAEWEDGVLFPEASDTEIARTKFLLGKYKSMRLLMDDYENHTKDMQQVAIDGEVARRIDQDALHADKAANAVILAEKQRWVYEQYRLYTSVIRRAIDLIFDDDSRQAIQHRYIEGHSFKGTVLFFRHGMSHSTVRRKLDEGTESIANTLKLMGFFEKDVAKYEV
ncbi:hypothetical protein [Paenibacillus durus]|uniref:Uncharacterized protein n=1 Tax=Paenibacillus durus ATCC 35681 TaxID=1333534 RepID=A0A0F7FBP1_PAEDU|nr:hypothetical protein [Paenibacillus durus]AKG36110.1 hypothetical protein VK70_17370 [Paenibacillus durus ATCC 35681]